jgi:hypothetical protein
MVFLSGTEVVEGEGVGYFATSHVLLLSHDDLLYVADRSNRRIQVVALEIGFAANRRLLDDQRIGHDCFIGEASSRACKDPSR